MLEARHITKQFSGHLALRDVDIEVPAGSVFGLLGPNGAGKTTLIRIINRITAPDKGELLLNGHRLTQDDILKIGYLPEERGLYKKMKVGEQALYLAQLKGMDKADARKNLKEWFEKFDILPWWNRKVEELSKGMQQKVQFIVTVMHRPQLLIFDEPFSGFDPINVNLLKDEILKLRDQGATVIFSTHNMASVEELCDHIALIDHAEKILDGKVADIKEANKENIWEILYVPSATPIEMIIPRDFSVIRSTAVNGHTQTRIALPKGASPNQLLKWVIAEFEVAGFTEVLPTMNDIFISQVNRKKNRHE
jgi:ABC-2 type transport system ATP-binding protein